MFPLPAILQQGALTCCIEQNDYLCLAQGCFGAAQGCSGLAQDGWGTDLAQAPFAAIRRASRVLKFQLGQGYQIRATKTGNKGTGNMGARALLLAVGWQLSILSLVTVRCDGLFWSKNIV